MIGQLMRQFGVRKSPYLAVIDKDGTLITKDGKQEFQEKGLEVLKEWAAGGETEEEEEPDVQVDEDEYEDDEFEQQQEQIDRYGLNQQQQQ